MSLNGQLDTSELTLVDGWARLENRAARAYNAACDKLVRIGLARPSITAPDGAYRDLVAQLYWKQYWTARGKPQNAAAPGYSNHGWGTAIDIWNVAKWPQVTLRSVFREFGFSFPIAAEPWHGLHNGLIVAGSGTPLSEPPTTKRVRDMKFGLIKGEGPSCYATRLIDGAIRPITPAELAAFQSAGYILTTTTDAAIKDLLVQAPRWFKSARDDDGNLVPTIPA